jgi:hypothetical protein
VVAMGGDARRGGLDTVGGFSLLDADARQRRSTHDDDDDANNDERCTSGSAVELTEHEAASFVHAMSE